MERLQLNDIEIELRHSLKTDIGFVYELMYHNLGYLFKENTKEKWSREKFKKNFEPKTITILEHEDMPIGFMHLESKSREEAYCGGLHLSEDYQGKGIGTAMLYHVFSKLSEDKYKSLTGKVFKNNMASLSLLRKTNFKIENEIPEENSYFVRRSL